MASRCICVACNVAATQASTLHCISLRRCNMQRGPGRGRLPDHQSPEQPSEKVRQSSASQFGRATGALILSRCQLRTVAGADAPKAHGVFLSESPLAPAPVVQTSWDPAARLCQLADPPTFSTSASGAPIAPVASLTMARLNLGARPGGQKKRLRARLGGHINRCTLNYFRRLVRQRPTTYAATHKATCLSGCAQA